MIYKSQKTYGNDRGFSCAFRQHKATHSHCSLIHGYSLGFSFTFEATELDENNWVYDFGGCKWIKEYLEEMFEHTLVIDFLDPHYESLVHLQHLGIARVVKVKGIGCEKFAEHVFNYVAPIVSKETEGRVQLTKVKVFEHGSNSAAVKKEIDYGS